VPPLLIKEVLGVEEGVHYEAIVTTFLEDGGPHAAAMGCRFAGRGSIVVIRPHEASRTAKNLLRSRCGALNIAEPEYIIETALDLGVAPLSFERCRIVDAPLLREARAVVEFNLEDSWREGVWVVSRCRALAFRYKHVSPRPYTRAATLLVEAAVRLSRVEPFLSLGEMEEARRLCGEARSLLNVAERLAGRGILRSLVEAANAKLLYLEKRIPP